MQILMTSALDTAKANLISVRTAPAEVAAVDHAGVLSLTEGWCASVNGQAATAGQILSPGDLLVVWPADHHMKPIYGVVPHLPPSF